MIIGNGGSAALSQEMAAEFICKFENNRPPLPAMALATDASVITAIANDVGFDKVFERQIWALGRKNDVLLIFSTSKKFTYKNSHSRNIYYAFDCAEDKNIKTIFAPRKGKSTAEIQEYQHKWMHQVVREVEEYFL